MHLPQNLPDPASKPDAFEDDAIRAIAFYLEQTHGKAFVLFTSHRMLEAARILGPWLAANARSPFTPRATGCRDQRWSSCSSPTSTA